MSLAEDLTGPRVTAYRELAARHGVWLSLGGIHTPGPRPATTRNTHLLLDSAGNTVQTYHKVRFRLLCLADLFPCRPTCSTRLWRAV